MIPDHRAFPFFTDTVSAGLFLYGSDSPVPYKEIDRAGTDSDEEVNRMETGSKQRTNLQEKFLASLFFVSVCQTKKSLFVFMSVLS